jgi:tetratricopeptide (TPR) repeat protein
MSELALLAWLTLCALPSSDAAARSAAGEARVAYEQGQFQHSLAKYEEAYTLLPAPRLLFNLGQCHRRLGQHELAVQYFQRFLDAGQEDAAQSEVTAGLIADERQALLREDTLLQLDLTNRRLDLEAALRQPVGATQPITRQWWFWTAVGAVAVAAVTTGLAVGLAPRPTPTTFPDLNAR